VIPFEITGGISFEVVEEERELRAAGTIAETARAETLKSE
jgi:hypothetical protein